MTGSRAAAEVAPVAPPRFLALYVDRPRDVEQTLDLRPADAGANVAIFTPFDDVVFERTSVKKGITIAALSQIAVDLMTSPVAARTRAKHPCSGCRRTRMPGAPERWSNGV